MRMPLTFRLVFHGFRSLWLAVFLAIAAWLAFVPATQAERAALGNSASAYTAMPLATMRIARVVVHFAPDRAANMLSSVSNGEISPELAGMILRQLAGQSPPGPRIGESVMQRPTSENPVGRSVGGAKFVTVD